MDYKVDLYKENLLFNILIIYIFLFFEIFNYFKIFFPELNINI